MHVKNSLYRAVLIEEVNDAITFEQITFSKIDESKNFGSIVPIPLVPHLEGKDQDIEQLDWEQAHTHRLL